MFSLNLILAMDIDLLSKMVKELILDRDEVTLPGVGTFVAETVPASFSDKGYTINPPYRKLSFRQRQNTEDNSLIELYLKSNSGVDLEQAKKIVTEFLLEMKEVLKQKKNIVFPGLGRLRSTKENNFFFVADEDLDIYPGGFGLEPISLKTHQETPEEVSDVIQKLKDEMGDFSAPVEMTGEEPVEMTEEEPVEMTEEPVLLVEPVEEPAEEVSATVEEVEEPIELVEPVEETAETRCPIGSGMTEEVPVAEPVSVTEEVPVEMTREVPVAEPVPVAEEATEGDFSATVEMTKEVPVEMTKEPVPVTPSEVEGSQIKTSTWIKAVIWILGTILGLLILYILASHMFPDFFDSILYSKEELDILNF